MYAEKEIDHYQQHILRHQAHLEHLERLERLDGENAHASGDATSLLTKEIKNDRMKYLCVCGRSYQTKSAVNYHRKWICSNQLHFQCEHCEYKAKRYYCFKEHLERKHKLKALSKHFYLN